MNIQLAWHNLAQHKARTAVGSAGVAFAVILIFMQLGFLGATRKTATIVYDQLAFDILLRSPAYVHLCDARWFPRSRVLQAAALADVQEAACFYVGLSEWQHPVSGQIRGIMLMGAAPEQQVFRDPEIRRQAGQLGQDRYVLIDRKSKAEYGPADGRRFGDRDIGLRASLGGKQVQIMGHFAIGTGFASNGAVLVSDAGFARISPAQSLDDVNLGLLTLRDKHKIAEVQEALRALYQPYGDVDVLTRDQVIKFEVSRWVRDTSIGVIFWMGVAVSLVVGVAIVNQVLSADVANLIKQYATLKAMGYTNGYLSRVILQQAVMLAVLGFLVGLLLAWLLYLRVEELAGIPMRMTLLRTAAVLLMANGMCALSALNAARKVVTTDPADLF